MVQAAGSAARMTVPQMAIVAVAAIGMFWAVMLLVLGMSRRGTQTVPGHWIRAQKRHKRPGPRPSAAPASRRSSAAPLSPRRPDRGSQDPAARAGSSGYGPPPLWGDVPEDPHGWR